MIPRGSFTFEIKRKTRDPEDKEGLIWWSNQAGSTLPSAWGFYIMQDLAVDLQKTLSTRALGSHLWKMVQFNGNAITDVLRLKQPILSQTHLSHQVSGQVLIPNSC